MAFVVAHSIVDYPLQRPGMSGWFLAFGGTVLAAASLEKGNPNRQSSKRRPDSDEERSQLAHPESIESTDRSLATTRH